MKKIIIISSYILSLHFWANWGYAQFNFEKNSQKNQEQTPDKIIEIEYEEPKDTIIFEFLTKFDIPKVYIQKSYFYGVRLLTACNTSRISPFTESHFAPSLYRKISLDYLSIICTNVKREFGEFIDMRFVEVVFNPKKNIHMLRFKCIYEKKYSVKEFRVSFDEDGKIVGIKTLRWKDQFEPNKPKYKVYATEVDQRILDSLDKVLEIDFN